MSASSQKDQQAEDNAPTRRGRKVKTDKKTSFRAFYIIFGVIAIAGVAILITYLTGSDTTASAPDATTGNVPTVVPSENLNYETGITPDGFHYKGSADAPVQVVEYADFQCPACANFTNSQLYQRLTSEYIATGQIQYIFHDFPLTYHNIAPTAAQASYCAGDQGQYWAMHEQIFASQREWSGASVDRAATIFTNFAEQLGLDVAAFESCLSSGKYEQHVSDALAASMAAQIPATPTFVVDGTQVTANELMVTIEAALAQQ